MFERFSKHPSPLRWYQRPALAAVAALALLLTITLAGSYLLAKRAALIDAQKQAAIWTNSASVLVTPLILSKDLVSLNFVTNQIADDPFVAGIQITDQYKMRIAAAGKTEGIHAAYKIAPNGEEIAQLEVWIDPKPVQQQLNYQTVLMVAGTLVALLFSIFIYRRQTQLLPDEEQYDDEYEQDDEHTRDDLDLDSENDESFDENELPSEELDNDTINDESDDESDDDIDEDEHLDDPSEDESEEYKQEIDDRDNVAEEPHIHLGSAYDEYPAKSFEDEHYSDDEAEPIEPDMNAIDDTPPWEDLPKPEETQRSEIESVLENGEQAIDEEVDEEQIPTIKMAVNTQADDEVDIVDLLKPERREPTIPRFTPTKPTDLNERREPRFETVDIDAIHRRARKLPIITEEQLDLYTIEQELDLVLPAHEAGYLVLIDATSPNSGIVSFELAQQIRRTYRTLANSVANIYGGEVESLGEDIQILFTEAREDDEHGVNAICAAMLFASLVRSYNRSRAAQQVPILEVHTAIVRGQVNRLDRTSDEARFLTRSTKSDRLISHTALTEVPDLKASVLEEGEIKREDEDKVLIMGLGKSYQELLDKQARYLLAKLAQQAQQQ